jgi:hypothetical protein
MRPVYFTVCNLAKPSIVRDFCHGGTNSKQQITVLLANNEDVSDKLPL